MLNLHSKPNSDENKRQIISHMHKTKCAMQNHQSHFELDENCLPLWRITAYALSPCRNKLHSGCLIYSVQTRIVQKNQKLRNNVEKQ